ncbi:MAG: hypothetical protein ICV68_16975 [Pyrinomonadaceae bacterium]|nr:hypothetical protein [Pyrinomonadaceae bacterium]
MSKHIPVKVPEAPLSTIPPQEAIAYMQADIHNRLIRTLDHLEQVVRNYPEEPMVSLVDRVQRVQQRLAELSKDMFILELEKVTNKTS